MKKYIVNEELINNRIDKVVTILDNNISRMMVKKLLNEEKIFVNEKIVKASYKVKLNDSIEVEEIGIKEIDLKAEDIPLDILYEDNDIIVINKQKGMVVHPANGNFDGTLVNALMSKCKASLSGIGGEIRPGIVHRLDKDTSGIIVVAKNDKAHINLSQQIKDRKMKKTYICLIRGNIPNDEATIDMPIARSKKDRKKMAVDKEGKNAITHFKVLKRYNGYTLLKVNIETGRTHQIRVHLSSIGYPIIGDMVYSNGKNPFNIEGQMLHAKELRFKHPSTGELMIIEAPIPKYFEEVLEILDNQIRYKLIYRINLYKLFTLSVKRN